ncbi:MAG: SAM-dependent methyltransferase [Alphaproteobacteria bacterium]|nr:SAM-dependent methyltransferase [Alphaproteobacteria bacterium]
MERLDRFMARANSAYYARHDPFADFTTAPEITQVFGEILGLWAAIVWEQLGRPDPVLLAEAGPGRGTLMDDALRAISARAPDFHQALRLHFIEASPRLRAVQLQRFPQALCHERAAELPSGPLIVLANEFLDALPVRQFVRRTEGWVERYVLGGRFVELPAAHEAPVTGASAGEGEVVTGVVAEVCEPALALASLLGRRLATAPGAALVLDYGPEQSAGGDSLQAIRNGRPADPLADPGSADLTAHVDFDAFRRTAERAGAAAHGPLPQGLFLARLGLFQRTDRLARGLPAARAGALIEAARRLAEPDRMGRLFKALALCHPAAPVPPGFES